MALPSAESLADWARKRHLITHDLGHVLNVMRHRRLFDEVETGYGSEVITNARAVVAKYADAMAKELQELGWKVE